jgi:RNA polymerase sigma-70 factor (ECF subfamily)
VPTRTATDVIEPTPATDAELLAAIAHHDRLALASLHDRHAPMLLGLLHRMLGTRADAEDVLQDVFLQIWRKAGAFDDARGRPVHWMATLARSRALDRLRVMTARSRLDAVRGARDVVETLAADPSESAIDAEEARQVRRALAQLPDTQRTVLLLAYWKGDSQSEIARRLAAPLGTVKSSARLGLERLRVLLRHDGTARGDPA